MTMSAPTATSLGVSSDYAQDLAQAHAKLDEWRALPSLETDSSPEQLVQVSQARQIIANELADLYKKLFSSPLIRSHEISVLTRAIAVMRETTLIDLHLLNARANYTRVVLNAMGLDQDSSFNKNSVRLGGTRITA